MGSRSEVCQRERLGENTVPRAEARAVATYLIPSMRWLDRSGAMLGSRDAPGPPARPEWTLAPHAGQIEAYRFEVTVAKLLHGT